MSGTTNPAESDSVSGYIIEETVGAGCDPDTSAAWPDPPANGNSVLTELRMTTPDFRMQKNTRVSREVRSDGQIRDRLLNSRETQGGFGFEFHYGSYDDLIASVLRAAAWDSAANNTGISMTVTASSRTFAGTGIATGLAVGDTVRVRGASNSANNGLFKIATVPDANSFTVIAAHSGLVDEGPTASCATYSQKVTNGTARRSFLIELYLAGLASGGDYIYYDSLYPNLSFNMNQDEVTGRFDFLGAYPVVGDASVGDGSPTAANTNSVFQAEDGVGLCLVDDAVVDLVTEMNFSVDNGLQSRRVIKQGTVGAKRGQLDVTAQLTTLYGGDGLYSKNLAHTDLSLYFQLYDNTTNPESGNAYAIEIPRLVPTGGDQRFQQGDDVDLPLQLGAQYDSTSGKTIKIYRFPQTP